MDEDVELSADVVPLDDCDIATAATVAVTITAISRNRTIELPMAIRTCSRGTGSATNGCSFVYIILRLRQRTHLEVDAENPHATMMANGVPAMRWPERELSLTVSSLRWPAFVGFHQQGRGSTERT